MEIGCAGTLVVIVLLVSIGAVPVVMGIGCTASWLTGAAPIWAFGMVMILGEVGDGASTIRMPLEACVEGEAGTVGVGIIGGALVVGREGSTDASLGRAIDVPASPRKGVTTVDVGGAMLPCDGGLTDVDMAGGLSAMADIVDVGEVGVLENAVFWSPCLMALGDGVFIGCMPRFFRSAAW